MKRRPLLAALAFFAAAGAVFSQATNSNPLSDVRVRQALRYAIDMDSITKSSLLPMTVPANSLTPNGERKVSGLEPYAYNPEKAKQLLKDAKWPADYVIDVGYYYNDQQTVDLMTAIQQYWEQVGVKSKFRLMTGDLNTLLWTPPKDPVAGPSAVDWDLLYGATAALGLNEYYNKFIGASAGNSHTPTDAQYDKLVAATNTTADPAKQKTAFFDLQTYENKTLPAVPLYYQPLFLFSSKKLNRPGDVNGNAQYNYDWNIVNWTIAPTNGKQILRTNAGPVQFFEMPWFNPGVYIGSKVLFDRLIIADANLVPVKGGLASSYTVAPDGLSITFNLRPGIKWHDGKPITPEDVKWSIEYALKAPAIHAVFASTFNKIVGAADFKAGKAKDLAGVAIDGRKIVMKFSQVDPNMTLTFSQFPPLPKAYFADTDPAKAQQNPFWQKPIGSGPYMVKDVRMNDYAVFVPFKDYWGGVAKIDEIQAYPSGENDANLVVNATAGKIDYGYTKASLDAMALQKLPDLNVYPINVFYTRMFFVNKFPKK
jgi:ABC-type dipeptide transport system, periplasmic component